MTVTTRADGMTTRQATTARAGILLAVASAAGFGLAGPLAKSLLESGWSPAAVVAVRVGGAFLVLAIPCLVVLLREGLPTARQTRRLVVYGVVAVALAQLCYFNAVQYLSVGVALLLEYLAPVLLIGWHWWRTKTPPTAPVLIGAGVAMAGMVFVLDLLTGLKLHPIGVLWGLGAAICLCVYFILSDEGDPSVTTSPLLMTTVGTGVGAAVLLAAGTVGLVPLSAATDAGATGRHRIGVVGPHPADRGRQRGLRLPVRHHRGASPRQFAGLVRGLVGGAVRGHLRRDPAGSASEPRTGIGWRLGTGRYRHRPTPVPDSEASGQRWLRPIAMSVTAYGNDPRLDTSPVSRLTEYNR